ncbi:MAG: hypothetical protein KDA76_12135 [Planctomycetaceae bacterium]|nr:hypothetical protein [Planctomycetaceae bacterium]
MSRILTQAEKDLLTQKILRLEEAFDRRQAADQDVEMLFTQVLQYMQPGDMIRLPGGRTFLVHDPFEQDAEGSLAMAWIPGHRFPRYAWELREDTPRR